MTHLRTLCVTVLAFDVMFWVSALFSVSGGTYFVAFSDRLTIIESSIPPANKQDGVGRELKDAACGPVKMSKENVQPITDANGLVGNCPPLHRMVGRCNRLYSHRDVKLTKLLHSLNEEEAHKPPLPLHVLLLPPPSPLLQQGVTVNILPCLICPALGSCGRRN